MANTLEQGSCHSSCGTGWNGEESLADTAPFLTSYCSRAPGLPLSANKVFLGVSTLLDNCLAQVHSKVLVPQSSPCVSVALLPDSFAVTQLVSSTRKINPGAPWRQFISGITPKQQHGWVWIRFGSLCSVQLLQHYPWWLQALKLHHMHQIMQHRPSASQS